MQYPAVADSAEYVFKKEQQELFLKFVPTGSSVLFKISDKYSIPESFTLYKDSCTSKIVNSQTVFIDSTSLRSLMLTDYDLTPNDTYFLKIKRCNSKICLQDSAKVGLETISLFQQTAARGLTGAGCENEVYNGSFEELTTAGQYPTVHKQLYKSRYWLTPTNQHAADYFHSLGSNNFAVPSNLMGSQTPVRYFCY